jgi:hypothetical protein
LYNGQGGEREFIRGGWGREREFIRNAWERERKRALQCIRNGVFKTELKRGCLRLVRDRL